MGWLALAEDDSALRRVLARVLRQRYKLNVYQDGDALLDGLIKRPPRLVVTDVNMPGLSGIEAMRQARKAGLEVPVIFISSQPKRQTRRAALGLEPCVVLRKPVTSKLLLETVAKALAEVAAGDRETGDDLTS